jgi:uncharacterized protein (DUF4415 family)
MNYEQLIAARANNNGLTLDDIRFSTSIENMVDANQQTARQFEIFSLIVDLNADSLQVYAGNVAYVSIATIVAYLNNKGRGDLNVFDNYITANAGSNKVAALIAYTEEEVYQNLNWYSRTIVQGRNIETMAHPPAVVLPAHHQHPFNRAQTINVIREIDSIYTENIFAPAGGQKLLLYRGLNTNYFNDLINAGNDHIENQYLSASLDFFTAVSFSRNNLPPYNPNGFLVGIIVPENFVNMLPVFFGSAFPYEAEFLFSRHIILQLVASTTYCMDSAGRRLTYIGRADSSCRADNSNDGNVRYYFEVQDREYFAGGGKGYLTPYESMYNQIVEYEKSMKNPDFEKTNIIESHKEFAKSKTRANFPELKDYGTSIRIDSDVIRKLKQKVKTLRRKPRSIFASNYTPVSIPASIPVSAYGKTRNKRKRVSRKPKRRRLKKIENKFY